MTKTVFYTILSVLVFSVISSCSTKKQTEEKAEVQSRNTDPSGINTLKSRQISSLLDQAVSFSAYQNNSGIQREIGEFIHQNFSELSTKNNNSKLTSDQKIPVPFNFGAEKQVLKKTNWRFEIIFDNDIFDNTDYYYTNGLSIDLSLPALRHSPLNKIFPAPKVYDVEFCGFSLTQNMYTPINPDTDEVLYGDRPFSAYLTIGQYREVYDLSNNLYIKSQINFGVLGPSSLGGKVQSSIHEITPVGWQNQINDDIVINYSVDLKKGLANSSVFDLNVNANANIGTLYNNIGGGFDLRLGNFMPFYQGPVSVFENPVSGNRLQCWFFIKSAVHLVAYDATLQGGLFNESNIYTISEHDINRVVFQASGGFSLYYNNVGIEFENIFLTPEFKGARRFAWGRINAVLAF